MTKSLEQLTNLVSKDIVKVNEVIISSMQNHVALIPQLAQHIIASGGKRLRPALVIASAKLCGYNGDRHINLAACVELIHTATLLHDDVVDESSLRRGNQTANDIWGNKASVLVGDFLFSRSFQLMVKDGSLKTLKILSDASAIIAQGEVLQLETSNNLNTTINQYIEVVSSKTAELFSAAFELGAVVAETPQHEKILREAGLSLGIAFQIIDDTLDYVAEQQSLGKTVGDDFREGKITLPIIFAFERSDEQEKLFWHKTLENQEINENDLEQAINIITKYDAIADSMSVAQKYCDIAYNIIAEFPDSAEKSAILSTIDFCKNRTY
jgi:octaprenyl-diphosphate synthase